MEVVCGNCGSESAYFNGVSYECPDCDNQWGEVTIRNEEEEE